MPDALMNRLRRWAQLPADALEEFNRLTGRRISLQKGGRPFATGDPQGWALFMLDGWAAQYKDTPGGKRVIIEFILPGDVQMPTIHRDRAIETIMLSSGEALLVPPEAVEKLRAIPQIHEALDWIEKVRESIRSEWIVNISSRKAPARLAHLLCELSVRLNSAGMLDGDACAMPLTQIDLSNALSMTNVHLNLALQKLRSAGLVEMHGRRLTILDRAGLETLAGFDDGYLLRWPTQLPDRRTRAHAVPEVGERRRQGAGRRSA